MRNASQGASPKSDVPSSRRAIDPPRRWSPAHVTFRFGRRVRGLLFLALLGVALPACEDKAQNDYGKCVANETSGKIIAAAYDCEQAIKADPNSTSGKAAAEKLAAMQPALVKAKADSAAAIAKAEEEAAQKRAAEARAAAARAAQLQAQATIERSGSDDTCVSAGKGKRGLRITGGTYDDNEAVARSMGCVREHVYYPQQGHSPSDNYFCCP